MGFSLPASTLTWTGAGDAALAVQEMPLAGCCRTLSQHRGSLRGMSGSRNSMTLTSCIAVAGNRYQTFFLG